MKNFLLKTLITTFVIIAILGIGIIVFEVWNEFTAKTMATLVTLFGFSVPGLCCAIGCEKAKDKSLAQIGMVMTFTCCVYMLIYVWCLSDFSFAYNSIVNKLIYTSILTPSIFAHISLMSLVVTKDIKINIWKYGTINLVAILGIMAIFNIYCDMDFDAKIVIILIILAVLGTIVTPLLYKIENNNKIEKPKEKEPSPFLERYEEIAKLKELLDSGAITQEEFDSEKHKLLNS